METTVDVQIGKTLFKDMGWRGLRSLQRKAYESINQGGNTLLTAGTASGKTEAALLPVLSTLLTEGEFYNSKTPVMFYVAPLKALINDIYARIKKLTSRTPLTVYSWHGDVSKREKTLALKGSSIIVTTPESLEGMFVSKKIDQQAFFQNVRFMLIDELHALINGPRGAQLASLIERMDNLSRYRVQRIAMSATIGNPEEVLDWLKGGSDRETVHVGDSKQSDKMLLVRRRSLEALKEDIDKMLQSSGKCIIFTSSKQEAEVLNHYLDRKGYAPLLHHGSIGRGIREKTENTFKDSGEHRIMIATTTLEMGIDIGDVSYVFFYSVPKSAASFMQRLGRAGRKSGVARAVLYVNTDLENENKLLTEHLALFANVQLFKEGDVEPLEIPRFYPQILGHQIISEIISKGKAGPADLAPMKRAYCFGDIEADDLKELLNGLCEKDYLTKRGTQYRLSRKGNNLFGGASVGEFLSVFDAGTTFSVYYGEKEIGKIHYATLSSQKKLEGGDFSQRFILAGRAWKVIEADPFKKTLKVSPAQKGVKPMWLGKSAGIAERFARAGAGFVSTPEFPDNCRIDPDVFDSLLESVEKLKPTVPGDDDCAVLMVRRKKTVAYHVYTYAGEIKNLLYSLLMPGYFEGLKKVRYDWRELKFTASSELDLPGFFIWMRELSFEEFADHLKDPLEEESKKIGELLFQDRFADIVSPALLIKAYTKRFWHLLS